MRSMWFLVMFAAACGHEAAQQGVVAPQDGAPVHVTTAKVESVLMPSLLQLTGTVVAAHQTTIPSDASGVVTEVRFSIGDHVKRGQVLAVLDTRVSAAQAAASGAQAKAQAAQLTIADQECARAETLKQGQAISTQRYESILAQCAAQRGVVDAANASAHAANVMVERAQVRAPFDGVIGEKLIDVGAFASGATPIATLFDDRDLRVRIAVPDSLVGRIADGAVTVIHPSALPDVEVKGVVHQIGGGLRDRTHDLLVEAELDKSDVGLVPGMFARVDIEGAPSASLAIPDAAVKTDGTVRRVFVVREGRAFEAVVRVGLSREGRTAILTDLAEGESVVVDPPADLIDGSRVE